MIEPEKSSIGFQPEAILLSQTRILSLTVLADWFKAVHGCECMCPSPHTFKQKQLMMGIDGGKFHFYVCLFKHSNFVY